MILIASNALLLNQDVLAQNALNQEVNNQFIPQKFLFIPQSEFVVNPFPNHIVSLVQPLDSLLQSKGLLNIKFDNKKTDIILSNDWSNITIVELIDGRSYRIPFSSNVDYYLKQY